MLSMAAEAEEEDTQDPPGRKSMERTSLGLDEWVALGLCLMRSVLHNTTGRSWPPPGLAESFKVCSGHSVTLAPTCKIRKEFDGRVEDTMGRDSSLTHSPESCSFPPIFAEVDETTPSLGSSPVRLFREFRRQHALPRVLFGSVPAPRRQGTVLFDSFREQAKP